MAGAWARGCSMTLSGPNLMGHAMIAEPQESRLRDRALAAAKIFRSLPRTNCRSAIDMSDLLRHPSRCPDCARRALIRLAGQREILCQLLLLGMAWSSSVPRFQSNLASSSQNRRRSDARLLFALDRERRQLRWMDCSDRKWR